jgi:Flp pilus assembly protein TadG
MTRPTRERGQSLVEMSLMMVFLVVLAMGVLDIGRAYFTYLALKDAAAEGAYYGSAFPQCTAVNGYDGTQLACDGTNTIPYRTEFSAPRGGLVDWRNAIIGVTLPMSVTAGQPLTVSISYRYQMLTPFVGAIANTQVLTLTASSSATIIRVPNCTSAALGCQ